MILIAESGSSKTDWVVLGSDGEKIHRQTFGINPFYQDSQSIFESLTSLNDLRGIHQIFFYGAGCANEEKNRIVEIALLKLFPGAHCQINSDLLAAARSLCKTKKGIACILGTGSNSCYYNGNDIEHNVSPLGFILGDEGSGAVLGRKLISDILKKQAPQHIIDSFFEKYDLSSAEIIHRVYREAFPNRFLAQFTIFLSEQIQDKYISRLVINSFIDFFERNIKQYQNYEQIPVHFTGSIAFYFYESLTRAAQKTGVQLGEVHRSPLEGLIEFHTEKQ